LDTKLLSLKETEAALNLGHTKVCELIADGDIESIKVGRRRLITPKAIERFIARMAAGEPTAGDLRRKSA
jgi:excisionase family DNA binding protein